MCQREPLTSRQQAASSDAVPVGGEQRLVLWKRRQRGATMVEFSLVFVLFLTTVVGLMEFGRWIWAHHTLAHATRQAVRYAIVHGSESDAPAYPAKIKQVLSDQALGLAKQNLVVNTTWTPDTSPGSVVQVQAQYTFQFVTPLIFPQLTTTFSSTSAMVMIY